MREIYYHCHLFSKTEGFILMKLFYPEALCTKLADSENICQEEFSFLNHKKSQLFFNIATLTSLGE